MIYTVSTLWRVSLWFLLLIYQNLKNFVSDNYTDSEIQRDFLFTRVYSCAGLKKILDFFNIHMARSKGTKNAYISFLY